ncbi:MAG: hypothetical protein ISR73_04770 [Gammaproteobacteria bacterium]|nr:hypothetical protein [Gammaproteobacteria bacterium]
MAQKLKQPKLLTDFNNDAVCILPIGFDLNDERWEKIWTLHEQLKRFISPPELRGLFPEEPVLIAKKIPYTKS